MVNIKERQSINKMNRRANMSLHGFGKEYKNTHFPGQHGRARRSRSEYSRQHNSTMNIRRTFNMTMGQLRTVINRSKRSRGDTSGNIYVSLSSRLDYVVHTAGFTPTIFSARQIVSHKHVMVNEKTVNIPSYTLKEGDIVQLKKDNIKNIACVRYCIDNKCGAYDYLEVDNDTFSIKFNTPNEIENSRLNFVDASTFV